MLSNQLIISPSSSPTSTLLQTGCTDPLVQDLINLQKRLVEEEGVATYIDPDTGSFISCEDYWEKIKFESQPGYVIGKLLREGAEGLGSIVSNTVGYVKNSALNIRNRLADTVSWLAGVEEFEQNLLQELTEKYNFLLEKNENAKKEAEKNNKPLMVLIGEEHYSDSSAVLEILILHAVMQKLAIKTGLMESYLHFLSVENKFLSKIYLNAVAAFLDSELINMGFNLIFIDLARCDSLLDGFQELEIACKNRKAYPQIKKYLSKEGLTIRNTVMSEVTIAAEVDDNFSIVGAKHLYGLIKETDLAKHFHILPINTIPCSQYFREMDAKDNASQFFCGSEEVLQASINEGFLRNILIIRYDLIKIAKSVSKFEMRLTNERISGKRIPTP